MSRCQIKYPAEKCIQQTNDIDVLSTELYSDKFAIGIKQNLYITKTKSEADFVVAIQKGVKSNAAIAKELKDPAYTHKYTNNSILMVVRKRLEKSQSS